MSSNEGGMVGQPGSGGGPLWMNRLGALLEIDLRSLALFRIGVAATLLADLASRVRDLRRSTALGASFPQSWHARSGT